MAASSEERNAIPGFQKSTTTGVEFTIYPQAGDPVTFDGTVTTDGRYRHDPNPSIIQAQTQKQLGAPSGNWSVTLKPGGGGQDILRQITDDDWVDLVFKEHGRRYHVVRGLVDDVQRTRSVGGSGAMSEAYVITGRDFGKIWETTPIFFNTYAQENFAGAVSQKVFSAVENVLGPPHKAVKAFLEGMLRELGKLGRATWVVPTGVPNRGPGSFIQAVYFNDDYYPQKFKDQLIGLSQNWLMPQGRLWQLAQEWSDPTFNELYMDVFPLGGGEPNILYGGRSDSQELLETESVMAVVFRERPFPTLEKGKDSLWFSLPMAVIPREQIINDTLVQSGAERFNAFFVAPQITQEVLDSGAIDLAAPLWSPDDISRHGFRRFDVISKYANKEADILTLSRSQRQQVRDWYCVNPYLLSGNIILGTGRPDIRIGMRARIPGDRTPDADETYYVESVANEWSFGIGTRTNIGVTRGFIGTDDAYMSMLSDIASHYKTGERREPGVPIEATTSNFA